jgi:hypothetical protein
MQFARPGDIAITSTATTAKWCLFRIVIACAVACAASGCRRGDAPASPAAGDEPAEAATTLPADTWEPDKDRKSLPSTKIYYTLTDYAWYARGEPLVHEGRQHVPVGLPIAASVEQMEREGEYDGVEFYTRRDDADPVLYVPVFEGYWQAFRSSARGAASVARRAVQ